MEDYDPTTAPQDWEDAHPNNIIWYGNANPDDYVEDGDEDN